MYIIVYTVPLYMCVCVQVTSKTDWSKKYSRRSKGLHVDKIRRYGRQILEVKHSKVMNSLLLLLFNHHCLHGFQAMKFLYGKGFPVLGHVQSGNVFIDEDDNCLLGGYENTLLGYKTRLYRLCRNNLQHFDVIMFGMINNLSLIHI